MCILASYRETLKLRLWVLFFYSIMVSCEIFSSEGEEPHCGLGNFALPASQEPGPLISFGENLIERNQVQIFLFSDAYLGQKKHSIDVVAEILYGITDDFSVFFNVPVAVSYRDGASHSAGFEDLFLQFEYAIFSRQSSCSSDQVTLVANASFPTGSRRKDPPTGFGAMAFFLGTTYNRTWVDWFCFTSYGAEFTTAHNRSRSGNEYLYQFGFGRNITNTKDWILAWLVEIDGAYLEHDRDKGKIDPDSGGNVIYVTPSFWASSKDWILQFGLGYAVQQNLFGDQRRAGYLVALNLGRTF